MVSHLHNRRAYIYAAHQHPYRHTLNELAYSNPAFGGSVTNLEQAMNNVVAILRPNYRAAVATTGDLPLVGNTLNDSRVVNDDGDGKAATYRWEQREGDATPSWYKIYDMDWGYDSILTGFLLDTIDVYVSKYGRDDIDSTGALLTGYNAGQHVYGGKTAGSHLTLWSNSGDGVGAATGFIQMGDNVRPRVDSTISLGTTTDRWLKVWTDEATVGTMTITSGQITDTGGTIDFTTNHLVTDGHVDAGNLRIESGFITDFSGTISFDNENLTTTGSVTGGSFVSGTITVSEGSITDTSGAISFADENLTTTGSVTTGQLNADNLRLDGNTLSSTNANGNIILLANGTGSVDIQSPLITLGQTATGTVSVTGQFNADNIRLDANTIATTDANGDLELDPNGTGVVIVHCALVPSLTDVMDLGSAAEKWADFYMDGSLSNATNSMTIDNLMTLRDINSGVAVGHTIFWTGTKWESSAPDTEIDHGTLSGLSDDDHTQYVLLAGRAGGQTVNGGTAASDNLVLHSTAHATKGDILWHGDFVPGTTDVYDIGTSSVKVRDIYMVGEAHGLRLENFTTAGRPAAGNAGRIIYDTDLKDSFLDTGSEWRAASINKVKVTDTTGWDGVVVTVSYNVSTYNVDARDLIWCLKDNSNNFEQMTGCVITSTGATNVTVTFGADFPPAAGTYTLLGVG